MANYPSEMAPNLTFLTPDIDLGERANEEVFELMNHGFVAAANLTEPHAATLSLIAHEEGILEYCPDKKRFATLEKTQTWQQKGRGFVGVYEVFGNSGSALTARDLKSLTDDNIHMVAYGWSGVESNKRIAGADITTAYRVGSRGRELARERRGRFDPFRLGRPLGELVLGTAVHLFDADPNEISLETWESNKGAVTLYEGMDFVHVPEARVAEDRPTLRPAGTIINGQEVYETTDKNGQVVRRVPDFRRAYLLGENHPLRAAA